MENNAGFDYQAPATTLPETPVLTAPTGGVPVTHNSAPSGSAAAIAALAKAGGSGGQKKDDSLGSSSLGGGKDSNKAGKTAGGVTPVSQGDAERWRETPEGQAAAQRGQDLAASQGKDNILDVDNPAVPGRRDEEKLTNHLDNYESDYGSGGGAAYDPGSDWGGDWGGGDLSNYESDSGSGGGGSENDWTQYDYSGLEDS